ncbi:glycosyltransferase [Rossellomorea sp. DA94]|uniref:glycosyltransferase n=1 Tax=Rossellomorea sp. DA94 TaxID=3038653 RepID=UPI002448D1DA|nr:glycosyltransferase [Rossellomorea sp. DA94]WGG45870.1 glycosyltransferase [Rossellomorea sp. DA94]
MKKELLFVIDSLETAGAEKSLVTLLSMLDLSKFNVELMLFAHGNELEELIPKSINLLRPLEYTIFTQRRVKDNLINSLSYRNFKMLLSRMKYSSKIRLKKYSNPQKARVFWQSVSGVIEKNPKTYDVAISYAQGVPTFYVAEKVNAKKKIAWVNAIYRLKRNDRKYQRKYYDLYDKIVGVSETAKEIFSETFPEYFNKMEVIYDINNPQFISEMADIGDGYEDSFHGIRILTIGRLARQKGYDIALEACKKLKEKGIDFKWYVLGKGPLEEEIRQYIVSHGLTNHFILLGVKTNPYPFIKKSDIYVQTSKFEGFGLAIAEARMLNVPVVTTNFDAVYNQMVQNKNGLVVNMDPESVADGIINLIHNHNLRNEITEYLKHEKKGNVEEIEKFYNLVI